MRDELRDQKNEGARNPYELELDEAFESAGYDSLALLGCAGRVNQFFSLHETGAEDYLLRRRSLNQWAALIVEAWEGDPAHICFQSSGSTGPGRENTHAFRDLMQEIDCIASLFPEQTRVISHVAPHHIYGFLCAVLLPLRLNIEVVDVHGGAPGRREHGDLIVAVPATWSFIARSYPTMPEKTAGITSTAPLHHATRTALDDAGLRRLVELYGSSETAGIAWRESAEAYELFPYYRRGDSDTLRRTRWNGEEVDVPLPDTVSWSDDRHLLPTGRRDRAVQVGGHNVYPEHVARHLLSLPGVSEAAVRPVGSGEHTRLKAFIVPTSPHGLSTDDVLRWAERTLTSPERPVAIRFGSALPRNEMGKLCDWE